MQGYIETLSINDASLSAEQKKNFIGVALKNSCQLKMLVDQIFELAHLEDGQVSLNMESFNIAELLYDIVAKFTLKAQKKQITLAIEPPVCQVQVHSDIGKLERVLSNLLENAIRHTPEQGVITIKVEELNEQQCQLSVIDNGTGIKTEEIAYIFDARYRASNATQSKGQHTGLGLAITKRLLELLQTDIRVKSELGKGTSFSFNLRKAQAA